ncbi:MFS transporter [Neiella sp. HB171785]|uniref:MFS transporter n=1 Tax=Neiella litorisoli TaxID=2771431 RepID=A0A8J6R2M6_9GAMM|nr:MFS transporter [Neiella litorisoli]MBD1389035.1 MFS transporter [Neiella litorisoli]
MKESKLSVFEKVGFGAGDMSINVMIAALFYFMSYFYTDVFGLKPIDMGIMFLVARMTDAISDPLMGMITDRFKYKRGRFRPYFLYLAIPYGVSMVLLFTTPDLDYAGKLIWAYATYLFATLMFTGVAIPYISYIGVLTSDPKERLSANGYRMFFAKLANVAIVSSVPVLAGMWGKGDSGLGYQLAMAFMSGVGILLLLFCYFSTHERVEHQVTKLSVGAQFRGLLRNDQWLILAAACILGTLAYSIRGSVALYYAKYYLGVSDAVAGSFLSAGIAASIFSMVASTWFTKRWCKLKLFRWSQVAVGFISVLMFFVVKPGDVWMAFGLYIILSFVVDLHAPIFWSAIAEAVDYGHVKDGSRVSGLSFGGISFAQKAGAGLAGFAGGMLLDLFQYQPNQEQTSFTLTGLALMLTVIPGVIHSLMGWLMFKYRITNSFYRTMIDSKTVDIDQAGQPLSSNQPQPSVDVKVS